MTRYKHKILQLIYDLYKNKLKHCILCWRTEKERALVGSLKLIAFLNAIKRDSMYNNSIFESTHLCIYCESIIVSASQLLKGLVHAERFLSLYNIIIADFSPENTLGRLDYTKRHVSSAFAHHGVLMKACEGKFEFMNSFSNFEMTKTLTISNSRRRRGASNRESVFDQFEMPSSLTRSNITIVENEDDYAIIETDIGRNPLDNPPIDTVVIDDEDDEDSVPLKQLSNKETNTTTNSHLADKKRPNKNQSSPNQTKKSKTENLLKPPILIPIEKLRERKQTHNLLLQDITDAAVQSILEHPPASQIPTDPLTKPAPPIVVLNNEMFLINPLNSLTPSQLVVIQDNKNGPETTGNTLLIVPQSANAQNINTNSNNIFCNITPRNQPTLLLDNGCLTNVINTNSIGTQNSSTQNTSNKNTNAPVKNALGLENMTQDRIKAAIAQNDTYNFTISNITGANSDSQIKGDQNKSWPRILVKGRRSQTVANKTTPPTIVRFMKNNEATDRTIETNTGRTSTETTTSNNLVDSHIVILDDQDDSNNSCQRLPKSIETILGDTVKKLTEELRNSKTSNTVRQAVMNDKNVDWEAKIPMEVITYADAVEPENMRKCI